MKQKMLFKVAVGTFGAFSAFLLWKLWRENRFYFGKTPQENDEKNQCFRELKSVVQLLRFRHASRGPEIVVKSLFFPDERIICRNLLIDSCGDANCSYSHDEKAPLTQVSSCSKYYVKTIYVWVDRAADSICERKHRSRFIRDHFRGIVRCNLPKIGERSPGQTYHRLRVYDGDR